MATTESELLEVLKGIERLCDGNNPAHEEIWRLANYAVEKSGKRVVQTLPDIEPVQTGKEMVEESNEDDLKEMCHYYGSWSRLREVIDRLEDNDNEAALERHYSRY